MDTHPDGGGNNLLSSGLDLSSSFGGPSVMRPAPSMMSVQSAATAYTVNSGHSGNNSNFRESGNPLYSNFRESQQTISGNNNNGGGSNPLLSPLSFSQPYLNASFHSRYD